MATAAAIRSKLDKALSKVGPRARQVYKRTLVVTGNSLLGRQVTTNSDVLMNPQPMYTDGHDLDRRFEKLQNARIETVLSNGKIVGAGDYTFTMSASGISLAELQSPNMQLVLKDSSGNAEVLHVLGYVPIEFQGAQISFTVHAARLSS